MLAQPAPAGRLMLNNFSFEPTPRSGRARIGAGLRARLIPARSIEFVLPSNGTRVIPAPPGFDICWRRELVAGETKEIPPTGPWTAWSRAYTGPGRFLDAVVLTPPPVTAVATVEKAPPSPCVRPHCRNTRRLRNDPHRLDLDPPDLGAAADPVWTAHEEIRAWSVILTEIRDRRRARRLRADPRRADAAHLRVGRALRRNRSRHGRAGARGGVGPAVRADLAASRRDRGQRWSDAAGAARRAHAGHGGDRRHRHRAVGSEGQGGRAAGLAAARRREPAARDLRDRRLLPPGRAEFGLCRGDGAVSRSRLSRGQAEDRRRQRRRRSRAGRRPCAPRSASDPT